MPTYPIKNYQHLLGTPGFSDNLLNTHFKLYEGYVNQSNKLIEKLAQHADPKNNIPVQEFTELKRRYGWEFNGMRLHEYYFENLVKSQSRKGIDTRFAKKASETYGSFEAWMHDLRLTAMSRGIGWAVTVYDPAVQSVLNIWINEHDGGYLAGTKLLLIMDVFEHAFITDYGIKRADYIDAFFQAIDWSVVENRLTVAEQSKI